MVERKALKKEIEEEDLSSLESEKDKSSLDINKEKASEELQIIKDIRGMRKMWSRWLLGSIIAIIVFDMCFILLLGSGILSFKNEQIAVVFVSENLAKIAGLAIIVVKFLFDKDIFSGNGK